MSDFKPLLGKRKKVKMSSKVINLKRNKDEYNKQNKRISIFSKRVISK